MNSGLAHRVRARRINLLFTILVDSRVQATRPCAGRQEDDMGFFPSKSVPDSEYLLIRSTLEANMAANARTEQAAAAHHRIASCYLAKLFGGRAPKQSTPGSTDVRWPKRMVVRSGRRSCASPI
jgi:hypothetical protein